MYIDGKVLLNIVFIYISSFTHAMTQTQLHTAGMADISSAVFVFDEDLACQLEIEDLSDTEGILLP